MKAFTSYMNELFDRTVRMDPWVSHLYGKSAEKVLSGLQGLPTEERRQFVARHSNVFMNPNCSVSENVLFFHVGREIVRGCVENSELYDMLLRVHCDYEYAMSVYGAHPESHDYSSWRESDEYKSAVAMARKGGDNIVMLLLRELMLSMCWWITAILEEAVSDKPQFPEYHQTNAVITWLAWGKERELL